MHYVYMIQCGDDSIYTGYTTDVKRRVDAHRSGDGAKYTKSRKPLRLRRVEQYQSRSVAQSREYTIKQLSKARKEELIPNNDDRVAIKCQK